MKLQSACLVPLFLMSACVVDELGSIEKAAGTGPIDQQQPSHVGGRMCTVTVEGGGFAQGVTPGASSWEVVSLFLSNDWVDPDRWVDQPVTLEIRDAAPDGPALASATSVIAARSRGWLDFSFLPPVDLTPGSLVYLYAGIGSRVVWDEDRTAGDVYPGGQSYALCTVVHAIAEGDFAFITYAPPDPDSDGDGLPDAGDPSTAGDAAEALPDSSFHAPGHRRAIAAKLADAEAALLAGDTEEARNILEKLRRHLDGCETGDTADHDDWIIDCADQDAIRALIDTILATL